MDYTYFLNSIGEYGVVREVRHPLVVITGLPHVKLHELVIFDSGQWGEVFLIEKDQVKILTFSKDPIKISSKVVRTDIFISIPVGKELLGKIIDPLGTPLSSAYSYGPLTERREITHEVPGLQQRARIVKSLQTGVSLVDMLIPLGKGQKELIIGDRKTGKTTLLLSTIKRQVSEGSIAIYAAIGRKQNDIKKLQEYFTKEGIMDRVIIVATSSNDSPSLIYRTPYSAITIAEYFRDAGVDTVVVFDDLSAHARYYREIGLLAGRFPGRDSYPGDIFYIHAALIERAGNFVHPTQGSVSITCLPVVETVEGDLTGYIATNIMGMTDGHIFFDSNAYYKGRRPAIDIFLSVTRVGRQTHSQLKREINRELTAFLANYERMQSYSQFGAELSAKVKNVLKIGEKIYAYFNQYYTVTVPEDVQLVLFGLIWWHAFDDQPDSIIATVRNNLIDAYKDEKNRNLFKAILQVDTIYDLLLNISRNKDTLLALCKVASASQPK